MHDTMRVMTPAPELLPLLKIFYPTADNPQWAWAHHTLTREADAEARKMAYENPGESFNGGSGTARKEDGTLDHDAIGFWVYQKQRGDTWLRVKCIGIMRYADFGVGK